MGKKLTLIFLFLLITLFLGGCVSRSVTVTKMEESPPCMCEPSSPLDVMVSSSKHIFQAEVVEINKINNDEYKVKLDITENMKGKLNQKAYDLTVVKGCHYQFEVKKKYIFISLYEQRIPTSHCSHIFEIEDSYFKKIIQLLDNGASNNNE